MAVIILLAGFLWVIYTAVSKRGRVRSLAQRIQEMSVEEVRRSIGRIVPDPDRLAPGDEQRPFDGIVICAPEIWKENEIVGYLEETEHPGTPVTYLARAHNEVLLIDAESMEIEHRFTSLDHAILFDLRAGELT